VSLPVHQKPADDAQDLKLAQKIGRLCRIARMAANSTITTKRVRMELEPNSGTMQPRIVDDPEPTPVGSEVIIFREILGTFITPQDLKLNGEER